LKIYIKKIVVKTNFLQKLMYYFFWRKFYE